MQRVVTKSQLKPTEGQVIAPYVSKLEQLQSSYIDSLYSLYNQAKAEYHSGHDSKFQIERKYIPLAMGLENKAQNQVNSVLFTLRGALVEKGYPTDEVSVLRRAYYSEVAQMKAKLFGQVK